MRIAVSNTLCVIGGNSSTYCTSPDWDWVCVRGAGRRICDRSLGAQVSISDNIQKRENLRTFGHTVIVVRPVAIACHMVR